MSLFGNKYPPEVAARIPPGQRLVKTWPILHFGPVPRFDESRWDFTVSGLVENPFTLSYAELKALGPQTITADMHCVTGWSTLDNDWQGIDSPFSSPKMLASQGECACTVVRSPLLSDRAHMCSCCDSV